MRVTIGVPFYNAATYLPDCLRSVFAQTEQDWELLLVNDGSTDESIDIARSIDDPRVRVVDDGRNLGLPARLNQIAELARGDHVARQDADDVMHPRRLADQLARLDADRSLDAVGCPTLIIDEDSRVLGMHGQRAPDFRATNILRRVPFPHGTLLGRREWWRRNPYNPGLRRSQDREFWIRTLLHRRSKIAVLPTPRYYYRICSELSIANILLSYRNNRLILREHGPAQIGRVRTAAWLAKSYAKSAVWGVAARIGLSPLLSRSRATPISEAETSQCQAALDAVRDAPFPAAAAAA